MSEKFHLQTGKSYTTQDLSQIVKIVSYHQDAVQFPFMGDNGTRYTEDGVSQFYAMPNDGGYPPLVALAGVTEDTPSKRKQNIRFRALSLQGTIDSYIVEKDPNLKDGVFKIYRENKNEIDDIQGGELIRLLAEKCNRSANRIEELEEALRVTRRLVGEASFEGFVGHDTIMRLFQNNGAITKLVPIRPEDRLIFRDKDES